ncbi:hypothetical protein V8D89_003625 [Ganoderma adspersum]
MDGPRWSILAPRLAAILEAATHLEYLYLSATIRDPVFTAAAKVASIQELIVHVDPSRPSSREALRKFLTILRSPLRRLRINDDHEEDSGIYASFVHENLAHFASTLEVLELNHLVLDMDPSAVTTPFVNVRSLRIAASCYSSSRFLPVESLLRLFPNLHHTLEISALVILCEDGPRYDSAAERERSKEIQTTSTWSGLDNVICDTNAAFSLALRCPISRMEINVVWFPTEERDLAEVLCYNTPRKLLFSFNALHMNHLLFLSEATDELTHLVMSVKLDVNHPSRHSPTARGKGNRIDIPWDHLTTNLIGMVKPLRLTHFRVVLDYRLFCERLAWPTEQRSHFDATLNDVVPSETDLHPAAVQLFDAIPTLQYVFLAVSRYNCTADSPERYMHLDSLWESSKAWRAIGVDGDPHPSGRTRGSCVELDSIAAEVVLRREELKLHHGEKVSGCALLRPFWKLTPVLILLCSSAAIFEVKTIGPLPGIKLTYDILLRMISLYSCASEAVPLIATCRVLYHEGTKIALRKPVVLFNAAGLASFLKFLHAESSSRCRHLRQLELWGARVDAKLIRELLETLPLLVNLQNLQLADAEELLVSDPALPRAFAALTSLRHSPLLSVAVDFITDCRYNSAALWDRLTLAQWPNYHPTTLLANVSSTLEELQCVTWSTNPDWDVAINPSEKVYPNMRKLSMENPYFPLRIDPFIRAFPNLTHLNVHTKPEGFYWNADFELEDLPASHEGNIVQQLTSCGTWTHLEHFTGGLSELYAIGLTCRISRITIIDELNDELELETLATALQHARPLHLKFQNGIPYSLLEKSEPNFISTLRSEGISDLINLDIYILFKREDRGKDWRATVDNLVSALTGLRLKFLALRLGIPDLGMTSVEKGAFKEAMGCFPWQHLPTLAPLNPAAFSPNSMNALVARLESIPSLDAALIVFPSADSEGEEIENLKMITKGTSRLAGHEQWESWLHDENRFEI